MSNKNQVMRQRERCMLFVDFWNFQIAWNEWHGGSGKVVIPWKELPEKLIAQCLKDKDIKFVGAYVYASVNKAAEKDRKLNQWLHHKLAGFPGYTVHVHERKRKTTTCSQCQAQIEGTVEKGVDAALITDLLMAGFDDNYDVAILISGDADFAPAVEYIQKRTNKQVIQAFFKSYGDRLRTACWDHVFLDSIIPSLVKIK